MKIPNKKPFSEKINSLNEKISPPVVVSDIHTDIKDNVTVRVFRNCKFNFNGTTLATLLSATHTALIKDTLGSRSVWLTELVDLQVKLLQLLLSHTNDLNLKHNEVRLITYIIEEEIKSIEPIPENKERIIDLKLLLLEFKSLLLLSTP